MSDGGRRIPKGPTLKKHAIAVGLWGDFVKLRERLKLQGLTPRESQVRAAIELRVEEEYLDWRQRQTQKEILNKEVPLTPAEMEEATPHYRRSSITGGAEVGEAEMSLAEQIRWVKQQFARARNGGAHPRSFPNADCLYWYQTACTRPVDFDKIVLKVESPGGEVSDGFMRDGEYQIGEIEKQLKEAVREVGTRLVEYEAGMADVLHGVLQAGSEGSGEQSVVSA